MKAGDTVIFNGRHSCIMRGETATISMTGANNEQVALLRMSFDGIKVWVCEQELERTPDASMPTHEFAALLDTELEKFLLDEDEPHAPTLGGRVIAVNRISLRSGPPQTLVDSFNEAAVRWRAAARLLFLCRRLSSSMERRDLSVATA